MAVTSQLPAPHSPQVLGCSSRSSDWYTAYDSVLKAEEHASQRLTADAKGKLTSARVAGYLLLEFSAQSNIFGSQPSATLIKWFTSPPQYSHRSQHDTIFEIGRLLRDKFIRTFRTSNVPYAAPSSHPSAPSSDTLEDMIKDSMEATGRDYGTFRRKALARDGHSCVVTGILNQSSLSRFPELSGRSKLALTIETAHILNESVMQGIDPGVSEDTPSELLNKTHYAAGALSIPEMFGFSKFTDAFKEVGGVHQVWNLLSLEHNIHSLFDNLRLWFEHTDKPNRYKVCTLNEDQKGFILVLRNFVGHNHHADGAPMFVEFNARLEGAPPPDPLLLALHATCARVAHMSGVAEFFDQLERDAEDTRALAFDGSSAPLLSNLLSPFSTISGVG